MHKTKGFSFTEAMVSIAILGIIATIAVFDLRKSRQTDELNTAVRVVAADLRALQTRALTAANLKTCPDAGGITVVCENGTSPCADPAQCLPAPPLAVGARFTTNQNAYDLFADVDPSKYDVKETDATEVFFQRALDKSGAPNVTVQALSAGSPSDVGFLRQNGNMQVNGCNPKIGCGAPLTLTVTFLHSQSGNTKAVFMDVNTGRISIQ